MISFSSFPMKMLAYDGAIFVPIAVPLICKKCSPLNLSSIVREHWTTIQKHPELCKIFKEPPGAREKTSRLGIRKACLQEQEKRFLD